MNEPPLPIRSAPPRPQPPIGQAGFTLAELVVGIALTVLVLLMTLLMFDVNSRVSRVQTSVTDMSPRRNNAIARSMRRVIR